MLQTLEVQPHAYKTEMLQVWTHHVPGAREDASNTSHVAKTGESSHQYQIQR